LVADEVAREKRVEEDDNGNAPLFFGGGSNRGKENIDIDDNASAFDALWEGDRAVEDARWLQQR
jgi:hypothetical protein